MGYLVQTPRPLCFEVWSISWNKNNKWIIYCTSDLSLKPFSTTGRCTGPPRCDTWIWQAARAAIVTSSFKNFLTQTFPLRGDTCSIVPSRMMTQLFNGVNFVYRSVEVYRTFRSYLGVLVRIRNFYLADGRCLHLAQFNVYHMYWIFCKHSLKWLKE